jgi:hypothetical protein
MKTSLTIFPLSVYTLLLLGRTTTVVRDGSYVPNEAYIETGGLQGPQAPTPVRNRAFNVNFHTPHPVFLGFLGAVLGSDLGGERGTLPGALETLAAGSGPSHHIAGRIRNRDHGIVESGLNMCHTVGNILAFLFFLDDLP